MITRRKHLSLSLLVANVGVMIVFFPTDYTELSTSVLTQVRLIKLLSDAIKKPREVRFTVIRAVFDSINCFVIALGFSLLRLT